MEAVHDVHGAMLPHGNRHIPLLPREFLPRSLAMAANIDEYAL
jgi:hypothetical protein